MKKVIVLLSFFLLSYSLCTAQENETTLVSIVDQMSQYKEVTNQSSGFAGTVSPQYELFRKLDKAASQDELKRLLMHENPVIVAYSYWAIDDKNSVDLDDLALESNHLNQEVIFINGCIAKKMNLLTLLKQLKYTHPILW